MNDLGDGRLTIYIVRFTKDELMRVGEQQRALYLQLSQLSNETFMLYNFLIHCMNGMQHEPEEERTGPLKESSLGMILFAARLLAGRLYEARNDINGAENNAAVEELWAALPNRREDDQLVDEARKARIALNSYFGSGSLLGRVRNKLAFHADKRLLLAAFNEMPADIALSEFHSYHRGTTFMGIADTVTSIAVAKLAGKDNIMDGADVLMDDIVKAVGHFSSWVHAYFMAFTVSNFGPERLRDAQKVELSGLETHDTARATFFLASPA